MDPIDNYLEEEVEKLNEVEDLEQFFSECRERFKDMNDKDEMWEELMDALSETPYEYQKKFWDSFLSQRADK